MELFLDKNSWAIRSDMPISLTELLYSYKSISLIIVVKLPESIHIIKQRSFNYKNYFSLLKAI